MRCKPLVHALVSVSFGLLVGGAAHAAPVQWSVNGHWYEAVPWFVTDPTISSWEAAQAAAVLSIHMGMTGHLATITSAAENAFISTLRPRDQSFGIPALYMLGGFQSPTATTPSTGWQWVTGEAFSYTNWNTASDPDEPNNHNFAEGSFFDEDRLGFWATTNADGLTWNDLTGASEPGYVVEYESLLVIPEPETYALLLAGLGLLGFVGRRRRSAL